MPTFDVVHDTVYRYESSVSTSYGLACLLPRSFPGQHCRASGISIDPLPGDTRERVDFFGNRVGYFEVTEPHLELRITSRSTVEIRSDRGATPDGSDQTYAAVRAATDAVDGADRVEVEQFLLDSPRAGVDDRVASYARESFDASTPLRVCLADLMRRIAEDFEFDDTATTVTSTLDDLFERRGGVCQDFAHLAVACLRSAGIPARYVSGYLETLPPPGQPKLIGADASHAWASALIPGAGWLDFDPTNHQFVNDRYITTGWGRDYADVPPLKGVVYSDSTKTELHVSVDVTRVPD
jgi:transglutaminase-like putative cysteine protease